MIATLEKNRSAVLARVEEALRESNRPAGSVRVIAVTKGVEPELARALADLGSRDLAENRADELERKCSALAELVPPPTWHFVGHLQTNKVLRVVRDADFIHSIDSLRLLDSVAGHARESGRSPALFLQVKLADEPNKSGFSPEEIPALLDRARRLGVALLGLMTLAPLAPGPQGRKRAEEVFSRLAELARGLDGSAFAQGRPLLSMGMSGDFEEAIAAGADMLRIGSAFFANLAPAAPTPPTSNGRGERRPA